MTDSIRIILLTEDELRNLFREALCAEIERLEQKLLSTSTQELFGDKLRKTDVAKLLGVSFGTVSRYAREGILPKPKLLFNGRPYWEKEEVIAAIKANDLNWKYKL